MIPAFHDRAEAGRLLGARLQSWSLRSPLVLGVPRGGVVVAAGIADVLKGELDVVLAQKLRSPMNPELAIGAIDENGEVYLSAAPRVRTGVTREFLQLEQKLQLSKLTRRKAIYRPTCPAKSVEGRTVIVVDDGIATGSTMVAAVEVVTNHGAAETIIAVPVAAQDSSNLLRRKCDRFLSLLSPTRFRSVGNYYENFPTITDEEVIEILAAHRVSPTGLPRA